MAAMLWAVEIDSVEDKTQHVRAGVKQARIGFEHSLTRSILPDYQNDAIDHSGKRRSVTGAHYRSGIHQDTVVLTAESFEQAAHM